MTLLPIVERELRTRARRRFTYWSRLAAAGLVLLSLAVLYLEDWAAGDSTFKSGFHQFQVLKWICFAVACAAGLALTADSLSEEKREGTLGLLFLTDLRGYDIILGKLAANSVQAAFSLLAAFPVLAVSLLAGGVSGREFWLTTLVICNTLLLSLSAGMWVSSISRDALKAMAGTLFLLVLFFVGLPLIDLAMAGWDHSKFRRVFSYGSPGFLLFSVTLNSLSFPTAGFAWTRAEWIEVAVQFGVALALLTLASVCVPFVWREKASRKARIQLPKQPWRLRVPLWDAVRRKRPAGDPMLWLATRNQWLPRLALVLTAAVLGLRIIHGGTRSSPLLAGTVSFSWPLAVMVLYFCIAAQAARSFGEPMRNGAMELLLVTPVHPEQIVRNHWKALWQTFLLPTLCVIGAEYGYFFFNAFKEIFQHGSAIRELGQLGNAGYPFVVACILVEFCKLLSALLAVAWVGMWMGLKVRKTSTATVWTLCLVVIGPWILYFPVSIIWMSLGPGTSYYSRGMQMFTILIPALQIGLNAIFIFVARRQLMTRFRALATRDSGGKRFRPARALAKPGNLAAIPNVAGGG